MFFKLYVAHEYVKITIRWTAPNGMLSNEKMYGSYHNPFMMSGPNVFVTAAAICSKRVIAKKRYVFKRPGCGVLWAMKEISYIMRQ